MRKKHSKYILAGAVIFFLFGTRAYSQDKDIPKELYIAASIPDSLKENANSVVRYSETDIIIKAAGKKTLRERNIVTILNEKGDREAEMIMGYNKKYDNYSSIEMRIYDENGHVFKKYYKGDMYDGSAAGDETMVTDERFLAVRHAVAAYPVTVEIEYEEDENSFITPGGWSIQDFAEQSVQNSTCKVSINPAVGFRYKAENISLKPEKTVEPGLEVYTWKVKNLKAIKKEEHVLSWRILPSVSFATNAFNCYGYPGDFSTWQTFGKWIQGLNSDVCTLSPERVAEIKKMTDTIKTDKAKARFLYNYLQKNMRYVSITIGYWRL